MFDIGFWELGLIGLISLLVIGPERLPKVARITGFWLGKTQHMIASVKQEISDELQAEELRQVLKQQTGLDDIKDFKEEATNTIHSIKSSLQADVLEDSSSPDTEQNDSK